jgi:hypothetical protein
MKTSKAHSKRKWLDGVKSLAVITIGGGCAYLAQSYFKIPSYVILLFCFSIAYAEYRIGWLKDHIGLAELPKFDDQMEFLNQQAVSPKHDPVDPSSYPLRLDRSDELFLSDFGLFADVINRELKDTPWRLQSMADTDVGTLESDGPVFGRKYSVNYGAKKNGQMEVQSSHDYSSNSPNIYIRIEIYNARRFPLWILSSLMSPIFFFTCKDLSDIQKGETMMNTAMMKVLWPLNQQVVNVDELELFFSGSAASYLRAASTFPRRS